MADSPLMVKSKAFALDAIRVCKELRAAKCEGALINQFLRSSTSIGANIREAFYAHGKADFIAKLQIALKECSENTGWSCSSKAGIAAIKQFSINVLR